MPKTPKPGPHYSQEREWAVILEDLRGQFRTFGEGLEDVRKDLGVVKDKVGHLAEDVTVIKLIIPTLATKKDLSAVNEKVGHLAEEVSMIKLTMATKKDIEEVKKDIRDFGKRMALIESVH